MIFLPNSVTGDKCYYSSVWQRKLWMIIFFAYLAENITVLFKIADEVFSSKFWIKLFFSTIHAAIDQFKAFLHKFAKNDLIFHLATFCFLHNQHKYSKQTFKGINIIRVSGEYISIKFYLAYCFKPFTMWIAQNVWTQWT